VGGEVGVFCSFPGRVKRRHTEEWQLRLNYRFCPQNLRFCVCVCVCDLFNISFGVVGGGGILFFFFFVTERVHDYAQHVHSL